MANSETQAATNSLPSRIIPLKPPLPVPSANGKLQASRFSLTLPKIAAIVGSLGFAVLGIAAISSLFVKNTGKSSTTHVNSDQSPNTNSGVETTNYPVGLFFQKPFVFFDSSYLSLPTSKQAEATNSQAEATNSQAETSNYPVELYTKWSHYKVPTHQGSYEDPQWSNFFKEAVWGLVSVVIGGAVGGVIALRKGATDGDVSEGATK